MQARNRTARMVPLIALGVAIVFVVILMGLVEKIPALMTYLQEFLPGRH